MSSLRLLTYIKLLVCINIYKIEAVGFDFVPIEASGKASIDISGAELRLNFLLILSTITNTNRVTEKECAITFIF